MGRQGKGLVFEGLEGLAGRVRVGLGGVDEL